MLAEIFMLRLEAAARAATFEAATPSRFVPITLRLQRGLCASCAIMAISRARICDWYLASWKLVTISIPPWPPNGSV